MNGNFFDLSEVLSGIKSVLCVQAHPGELEAGAGGAIAQIAKNGARVFFLTVTDGSKASLDPSVSPLRLHETKREEAQEAGKLLGVSEQLFFDYTEGECPKGEALLTDLISIFRAMRPEAVLSLDPGTPYEFHPERLSVAKAAAEAALLSGYPHYYRELGPAFSPKALVLHTPRTPNAFIDVDGVYQTKLQALFAHKSLTQSREDHARALIDARLKEHGALCGRTQAEAFRYISSEHLRAGCSL